MKYTIPYRVNQIFQVLQPEVCTNDQCPAGNRHARDLTVSEAAAPAASASGVCTNADFAALMWQQQLSELLEQFAVAREVAGRIFPLHLVEQCACAIEHFAAGLVSGAPAAPAAGAGAPTRRRSASVSVPAHSILRSSGRSCPSTTRASIGILVCSASI